MAEFTTTDIINATGGKSVLGDRLDSFLEISTDSRRMEEGSLFVPLKGEHFDGHDYIGQSVLKGAHGVLFSSGLLPENVKHLVAGMTLKPVFIKVKDTLLAYQEVARYHRSRFSPVVIGVTGSNGKSTTKEMISAVTGTKYKTLKNEGNLNNHIGLPLTLLKIKEDDEVAVLEMGMNHSGEIRRLSEIALPSIGVVTNVGAAHIGNLGSLKGVARAKGELVEFLSEEGTAVLNADDPYVHEMKKICRGKVLTFGMSTKSYVRCTDYKVSGSFYELKLNIGRAKVNARLSCIGVHNIYNALAAVCTGKALGLKHRDIVRGLELYRPLPMRMEPLQVRGITIINDAYNANPGSMEAAIKCLSGINSPGRKIAVIGDMLELGEHSESAHGEVGRLVAKEGVDRLVSVGEESVAVTSEAVKSGMPKDRASHFKEVDEAVHALLKELEEGDCLLVKGSRGMRMERVVDGILASGKEQG